MIPPGYKQTEVGVIPEEWEVKPFTQVTDLITCGIAATPDYVSESQGYPFLSSTNVKEGRIVWSGYKHISAGLHRQLYRNNPPRRGDILYSRVGTFGEAGVVDVDFEFSVYVSLTLIKPGKALDSCYLMQLLNSNAYKQRAKDHIYLGGGVGNLNVDIVRRYPIVVPPRPEQRAIATALSDVDALLAALDRLIAKQRDLKQAAMQQLLTGQTRLPGFRGKWETKRLGDIAKIQRGASPRPIDSPVWFDENSPIGWVRISDVTRSGMFLQETTQRLSPLGVAHSRPVPTGSLIMSICATVGRPVITKINVCIHDGFVVFDNLQADQLFLYYVLKWIEPDWSKHGQTGSQMNLNTGLITGTPILLPPLPEQTAIATVLSDMDLELAALEQRRDKTRALKQGMMQELLTGRTRLI
jgi:type I restriction enzyme S subunit